ncbi:MAG: NRDE family protein [Legionella sp.]|nr:NRDE family protein [Legionella sp.]
MCLALIAIGQHPLYPLIILSNRDEFYARESAPADFWQESPNVFSGKDLVRHGAWLGVNKDGYFSLLTNYRDPKAFKSSMQSRGLLVSNYLSDYTNRSPLEYIKHIEAVSNHYNKFNLIIGNVNDAYYYSNVANTTQKLTTHIYCISNHLLDTPWYKVEHAKQLFSHWLTYIKTSTNMGRDKIHDSLFNILSDKTLSPDHLLPKTGIPVELEKPLSSIYVDVPQHQYGTYCSSIILFEKNNISFTEKIFNHGHFSSIRKTDIELLRPLF